MQMQKNLTFIAWLLTALCLMGFGGNEFFSTIQKSFYYRDETINIALKYKNTDAQMRIVKFGSKCHSSFRIYDQEMKQVYPLFRDEVKCVNFNKDFVGLAPSQNLVFRLSLEADKLAKGKYFIQGLVSGFRPGQLVKFEVLDRPKTTSGEGESCGKAINKGCDFGLRCNFDNSQVINLGVCTPINSQLSTGLSQRVLSTGSNSGSSLGLSANIKSLDKLGGSQKFSNTQLLDIDKVEYFANDPLSASEFKQIVFNKTFQKLDLADSNSLLTKQQAVYLLYYYLYSQRYPRSLNGLFFLDTVGAKYTDYIDAAASLGVINMSEKYFYPYDLVTRGEVLKMIDKFLAIRI